MHFNKDFFVQMLNSFKELVDKNYIDIDEGLSDAFTRGLWVPFVKNMANKDMTGQEEELARLLRDSVSGNCDATRKILEEASASTNEGLKALAGHVDPEDIDIYTYAKPSIADNERFLKIRDLIPSGKAGPKLG